MRFITICLMIIFIILLCCCKKSMDPIGKGNRLDTTIHDYKWQIYEFPVKERIAQNYFWDIFAASDTNVWAVGQIYTDEKDSAGQYVEPYNAAHWDGEKWTLKRFWLKYGQNLPDVHMINALWYFDRNSIYLARGSVYHYQGDVAELSYDAWTHGSVYHLWAASEKEIYGCGSNGTIVRYDGKTWVRMESGTTMNFQDIWGTLDEETGKTEVWTVGYNLENERHGIILKYDGNSWNTVFDKNHNVYEPDWDHTVPTAVWGMKDSVYIALSGMEDSNIMQHLRSDFAGSFRLVHNEDQGSIQAFHGHDYNDFFGVGHSDVVLHYNGTTMRSYFPWSYFDGFYHGVQHIGDIVIVVGNNPGTDNALILIGKR